MDFIVDILGVGFGLVGAVLLFGMAVAILGLLCNTFLGTKFGE